MTDALEQKTRVKVFDGWQETYEHHSTSCNATMRFAIFLPPQSEHQRVPALYWLSGLTCTEENFMSKAGAQRYAAEAGIALVAMDTSPRNLGLPGEDDSYDFGSGAAFYINATVEPWSRHYRMHDYVSQELPDLVERHFSVVPKRRAISGHSMGGHGALVTALRQPQAWQSVSAFSPIVAPTQVPWGEKAFTGYLGDDREGWREWDACELVARAPNGHRLPLLVEQGDADQFLTEQLQPERLREACDRIGHPLDLRMREGYDHSYYFIATYIGDHVRYHAERLFVA